MTASNDNDPDTLHDVMKALYRDTIKLHAIVDGMNERTGKVKLAELMERNQMQYLAAKLTTIAGQHRASLDERQRKTQGPRPVS